MQKKGLGRGLEALLSDVNISAENVEQSVAIEEQPAHSSEQDGILQIDIGLIDPNPRQPRKDFNDERLQELATSIEHSGLIQPLIVKKQGERYLIVAGERRWRAARLVGLKHIPVLLRDYSETQIMEVALIENLQRDDLNPLEEAAGIQLLAQEHDLTQEEIGERLGKSRAAITNSLRLLRLPEEVRELVRSEQLSSGHARALLSLPTTEEQIAVAQEVLRRHLSVRQTEALVRLRKEGKQEKKQPIPSAELNEVQRELQQSLATKVKIMGDTRRGSIRIEYYSQEQLEQLYEVLKQ